MITPSCAVKLNQIKLEFSAEHDRLLLRVASDDRKEVLLWLTRRCVKLLWPALVNVAQASPDIALQANPGAKEALLGFQHQKALQQVDFSTPYAESGRERPLGPDPILVARIQARREPNRLCVLSLLPLEGQGVHLTLDDNLLHSLIKLVQTTAAGAEWELGLELPQAPQTLAAAAGARLLN